MMAYARRHIGFKALKKDMSTSVLVNQRIAAPKIIEEMDKTVN